MPNRWSNERGWVEMTMYPLDAIQFALWTFHNLDDLERMCRRAGCKLWFMGDSRWDSPYGLTMNGVKVFGKAMYPEPGAPLYPLKKFVEKVQQFTQEHTQLKGAQDNATDATAG